MRRVKYLQIKPPEALSERHPDPEAGSSSPSTRSAKYGAARTPSLLQLVDREPGENYIFDLPCFFTPFSQILSTLFKRRAGSNASYSTPLDSTSNSPCNLSELKMDRRTEANQSREGLLREYEREAGENIPLRKSLEDAYRSSNDSDLDATDYLDIDPPNNHSKAYAPLQHLANVRRTFARRSKCIFITFAVCTAVWLVLAAGGFWVYKRSPSEGQSPPWYPTPPGGTVSQWSESYKKAAELVKQMTLPEKVNITTGTGWQMGLAVGNTGPAINVGFPALSYQDGPLGLRFADNATAFPAGITVGATWNKDLMHRRGKAHGNEARLKGVNVLLGPCVSVNFSEEYLLFLLLSLELLLRSQCSKCTLKTCIICSETYKRGLLIPRF